MFIDYLSFRKYREGEYWAGYGQFCEQFLNPLLLRAYTGIAHNAWYRGTQEGIPAPQLNQLLPFVRKLSWKVFIHVVLQARLHMAAMKGADDIAAKKVADRPLPLSTYRFMLTTLRNWIKGLALSGKSAKTIWGDYSCTTSYSSQEAEIKAGFVRCFVEETKPGMLWDIGCNTGEIAELALGVGAG